MRAQDAIDLIARERNNVFSKLEDFVNTRTAMFNAEIEAGIEPEDREASWTEVLAFVPASALIPGYGLIQMYEVGRVILFDREWGPRLKTRIDAFEQAVGRAIVERAKVTVLEDATRETVEEINANIADLNRMITTAQRWVNDFKQTPYVNFMVNHDHSYTRLIGLVFDRVVPFEIREFVGDVASIPGVIYDAAADLANAAKNRWEQIPWWIYGAYAVGVLGLVAYIVAKAK